MSRAANADGARPWIVYSVQLPQLDPGEHLRIRGEAGLSRCNRTDQRRGGDAHEGTLDSPCESIRHPYELSSSRAYNPRIGVRAFLGSSPSDLGVGLGNWHVENCGRSRHHCPLSLSTDVDAPSGGPDEYLNLAVVAFNPNARLGPSGRTLDVAELMGDCQGDDYDPTGAGYCAPVTGNTANNSKGALSVARFGEDRSPVQPQTTDTLLNHQVPVRAVDKDSPQAPGSRVLLSEPVSGLSPGDVIDASASFHLRDQPGDGFRFHHLVRGLIFIAANSHATSPGSPDRWLSGSMGTNCPLRSGCEAEKAGATVVPAGAPSQMWVTCIGSAVQMGGVNGAPTDVSNGRLTVTVDRSGGP